MNNFLSRPEIYLSALGNYYEFYDNIDSGTFGKVVKAWKKGTGEMFAIKIIKKFVPKLVKNEVEIITCLMKNDNEEFNIVSAFEHFQHNDNYFLVFEVLEQNLHDYQKTMDFAPLSLNCVRPILYQVLKALWKLKSLGIIHTDIKPENIMLIDSVRQPFRVKVIDFGSSFFNDKPEIKPYIQSRYYRSPEILLGAPYNEAIDMWSLGCVIAELFLGEPLYPGGSEYDMIRYILSTQGEFPRSLLSNGAKASYFFLKEFHKTVGTPPSWRLRTLNELECVKHTNNKERRKQIFSSLDDILRVYHPPIKADQMSVHCERLDRIQFVDLLKRLLELDQNQRITPWNSIQHTFLNLNHLAEYKHTEYFKDTQNRMIVCRSHPHPAVYPSSGVNYYRHY